MAEIIHSSNTSPVEVDSKNQEIISILGNEVPKTISSFQEFIKNDSLAYLDEEGSGIKKWDDTIAQLDFLNDFLSRYQKNPEQFTPRVTPFNKKNGASRINIGYGVGKPIDEEGEDQLSIIFKDPTLGSQRNADIYSAGLSRKPSNKVLSRVDNYEKSSIQINTSHVYLDNDKTKKVIPYAGIIYNLSRTGIESFGIYYVGTAPFYISISKSIDEDQFKTMEEFVRSSKTK